MAEYSLSLGLAFRLSFTAGLALLEARACRLFPGQGITYIDRAIIAARNATARRLRATHDIVA